MFLDSVLLIRTVALVFERYIREGRRAIEAHPLPTASSMLSLRHLVGTRALCALQWLQKVCGTLWDGDYGWRSTPGGAWG